MLPAKCAQKIQAINTRKIEIKQNKVVLLNLGHFKRFRSIVDKINVIAIDLKSFSNGRKELTLVFYHKDLQIFPPRTHYLCRSFTAAYHSRLNRAAADKSFPNLWSF